MVRIKTAEERARLDAIFAEIEAEERGETLPEADTRTLEQVDEDNRRSKIDRLANLERKEFLGNVKANIGNGAFRTKWEQILSQFIVNQLAPMNDELNILRNFANAVDKVLTHCTELARKEDNHHHYKVFADRVRKLLEAI